MIALDNRIDLATEYQGIAEHLLELAQAKGASSAEVDIDKGTGLSVEVRMGAEDKLQHHNDQTLNITVFFGHRKGVASTGDFSKKALEDALEAACQIARHTSGDGFKGLADAATKA